MRFNTKDLSSAGALGLLMRSVSRSRDMRYRAILLCVLALKLNLRGRIIGGLKSCKFIEEVSTCHIAFYFGAIFPLNAEIFKANNPKHSSTHKRSIMESMSEGLPHSNTAANDGTADNE
eukprot:scaffold14248_cov38-Cyclotella_meneghiniana.AAC.1